MIKCKQAVRKHKGSLRPCRVAELPRRHWGSTGGGGTGGGCFLPTRAHARLLRHRPEMTPRLVAQVAHEAAAKEELGGQQPCSLTPGCAEGGDGGLLENGLAACDGRHLAAQRDRIRPRCECGTNVLIDGRAGRRAGHQLASRVLGIPRRQAQRVHARLSLTHEMRVWTTGAPHVRVAGSAAAPSGVKPKAHRCGAEEVREDLLGG